MPQQLLLLLASMLILGACTHIESTPYGIQKDQIAFVPARIAVLPCSQWPHKTRYYRQPLSNLPKEEIAQLCQDVDKYILDGFSGQPYMRGLSPKLVQKLLKRSGKPELLQQMQDAWWENASACESCGNSVSLYKQTIANQKPWLNWLNQISKNVYNTDAVLVPFILYGQRARSNDRGLDIAFKRVGLSLLLIDTNNGRLIWAGGRDVQVNNRRLTEDSNTQDLDFPSSDQVKPRLLIKDIWAEFPGRQTY